MLTGGTPSGAAVLVAMLALAGVFLAQMMRTFGFLRRFRDRKPLSCDLCMSAWSTGAAWLLAQFFYFDVTVLHGLAAAGTCFMLLRRMPPPALPPMPPLGGGGAS